MGLAERPGTASSTNIGTSWKRVGFQRFSHISVGGGFGSPKTVDDGKDDTRNELDVLRSKSSVNTDGEPFTEKLPVVWAVNDGGVVYRRLGITRDNRAGTSWKPVSAWPAMREVWRTITINTMRWHRTDAIRLTLSLSLSFSLFTSCDGCDAGERQRRWICRVGSVQAVGRRWLSHLLP